MGKFKDYKSMRKGSTKQKRKFWVITIVIGAALGLGIFWLLVYLGVLGIGPSETTFQVFDMADDNKDISDKVDVTVYRMDKSKYKGEGESLDFSDFEVYIEESKASTVKFTMSDDYIYRYHMEYKGSDYWDCPMKGVNYVYMLEKTENMDFITFDEDLNTNITLATSDYTEWTLRVRPDEETGVLPYYDFKNGVQIYFIINFTFNGAGDRDYVDLTNYLTDSAVIGNSTLIGMMSAISGETDLQLELDDDVGVGFQIDEIRLGLGELEGTIEYF